MFLPSGADGGLSELHGLLSRREGRDSIALPREPSEGIWTLFLFQL